MKIRIPFWHNRWKTPERGLQLSNTKRDGDTGPWSFLALTICYES